MAGEETRRQLQKNVASNIEQVLAATPYKAPTIRPPAYHHEIQVRRNRYAGMSSYVMYSYGPPHMAEQKQDD